MSNDTNKQVLAGLLMACTVFLFALLAFVEVPTGVRDTLLIGFTLVLAKFGTMVDYFFGSSEGSKEKTKLLGDK